MSFWFKVRLILLLTVLFIIIFSLILELTCSQRYISFTLLFSILCEPATNLMSFYSFLTLNFNWLRVRSVECVCFPGELYQHGSHWVIAVLFFVLDLYYRATEEQRGKRYPIKIILPIKSKLFGEVCDIEKFVVRKHFLFLPIKH